MHSALLSPFLIPFARTSFSHAALALLASLLLFAQPFVPQQSARAEAAPAEEAPAGPGKVVKRPHMDASITVYGAPDGKVHPGSTVYVALNLMPEAHWHTYWINPGDAGLAPTINWSLTGGAPLPAGVSAGPLKFPTPHKFIAAGATNYGYEEKASFITAIQIDQSVKPGTKLSLEAGVDWLVCKEICLPGSAAFSLELTVTELSADATAVRPESDSELAPLLAKIPAAVPGWTARADAPDANTLRLIFKPDAAGAELPDLGEVYFFASTELAVVPSEPQVLTKDGGAYVLTLKRPTSAPALTKLNGVLKAQRPFATGWPAERAWQLPELDVASKTVVEATPVTPTSSPSGSSSPSAATDPVPARPAAAGFSITDLLFYSAITFATGLILNVMPCVLPVLSLKIFSFMNHGAHGAQTAWRHGLAYSLGVMVSFWAIGLALILLRLAYPGFAWGFLMQEPWFVMAMAIVFMVMAISMFGVFEVGASLSAAASQASPREGLWGSFGSGALATASATPCTGPLLTAPILYAFTQPIAVAMIIFTALGLGMAAPYMVLSSSPSLLKYVPRPGAWMESVKQFMGFMLLGSAALMIYFLNAVAGSGALFSALMAMVIIAMACWVYGRWCTPDKEDSTRLRAGTLAAIMMLIGIGGSLYGITDLSASEASDSTQAQAQISAGSGNVPAHDAWYPYSPEAVEKLRAAGKPVFIDFTADWCINCKFYERTVLHTDSMRSEFKKRGITTFKADFTKRNIVIAKALERYESIGVPVYVLYGADPSQPPAIWRDGITSGSLLEALAKSPERVTLKQ
ncbi:MAG: thioredoxin family protein [Candidatus Methylacidiphilales bacterium]